MAARPLYTAELLFQGAQRLGLSPCWLTPGSVFAINVNGHERYIDLSRSPLNSDVSVALAKNKYVTRHILDRHQLPNIPFVLPESQVEAEAFLDRHKTVVAKPVSGSGSRDIHIISDWQQLGRLRLKKYLLEKYIAGRELRYLILNGSIIGVQRSDYGLSVAEDRPLKRIAYYEDQWNPAIMKLTQQIAIIMNLKFAAIDYLVDSFGKAYVLEVNTMPGFKWFHAPTSGPVVDVARLFLESVVEAAQAELRPAYYADFLSAPHQSLQLFGGLA